MELSKGLPLSCYITIRKPTDGLLTVPGGEKMLTGESLGYNDFYIDPHS